MLLGGDFCYILGEIRAVLLDDVTMVILVASWLKMETYLLIVAAVPSENHERTVFLTGCFGANLI